jgi:hypothetical protein
VNEPRLFEISKTIDGPGPYEFTESMPQPHWVMWGQAINFFVVDQSAPTDRASTYVAVVRLCRSRSYDAEQNIGLAIEDIAATGDSFFSFAENVTEVTFSNGADQITFSPIQNSNGRLAGFSTSAIESTFDNAVKSFREATNHLIRAMMIGTNVPCLIDTVIVRSVDTRQQFARYTLPFPSITLTSLAPGRVEAMEPFISLYGEGLREPSPFYRFLCFFKIVDKLLAVVLNRLREAGVPHSVGPPDFSGPLPHDPFDVIFPAQAGRRYTAIRDALQDRYRNVIAHLDLESPVRPFDIATEGEVASASRAMSFIAHDLLFRTYEHLKVLEAAGVDLGALDFT